MKININKNIPIENYMAVCPFCGSNKVGLTTQRKKVKTQRGIREEKYIQGLCHKCFGRGPKVVNDDYLAVELWNKAISGWFIPKFKIEDTQLKRFLSGEILINTTNQLETNILLYSIHKHVKNCEDIEGWARTFSQYKEYSVYEIDIKSKTVGFCDIKYFKESAPNIPIETLIAVDDKR